MPNEAVRSISIHVDLTTNLNITSQDVQDAVQKWFILSTLHHSLTDSLVGIQINYPHLAVQPSLQHMVYRGCTNDAQQKSICI